MHGFGGASGDVWARGPGFPPDLSPRAAPSPPVSSLPKHSPRHSLLLHLPQLLHLDRPRLGPGLRQGGLAQGRVRAGHQPHALRSPYRVASRAWLIYNMVNCITNVLFLALGEGDNVQTLGLMVLNGIPVGGQFPITSILADVIDSQTKKNPLPGEAPGCA